jgi:CDGSH iron-sulfur domain-containing protein 3
MNSSPEIGGRAPLAVDVEAGKSYWWCACGRSKTQPFCDGSHKGTLFSPFEWKPDQAVLRLQAHRQSADVRRQP